MSYEGDIMPERYLPISEAAKRLGVHHTTLRKWANEGKIDYTRTVGRRRRPDKSGRNQPSFRKGDIPTSRDWRKKNV